VAEGCAIKGKQTDRHPTCIPFSRNSSTQEIQTRNPKSGNKQEKREASGQKKVRYLGQKRVPKSGKIRVPKSGKSGQFPDLEDSRKSIFFKNSENRLF